MEHRTSVDDTSPPKKKHKTETVNANEDPSSYVWHYYEVFTDTAKCQICQHEIGLGGNPSTTNLMQHLLSVHRLTDIRSFIDDFGSIPTMCIQSANKSLCMHERVFLSFENSSRGAWQCKQCPYAIQKRTLYPMFEHLKNVHWKPSKPNSGTTSSQNHNQIVDDASNRLITDGQKTKNDILGDKTAQLAHAVSENNPKAVQNIESRIPDNLNNNRDACESPVSNNKLSSFLDSNVITDSYSTKHYKVRISFPNGNEVDGIYLGNEYDLCKDAQGKNSANLIRNHMSDEVRSTISPIVLEKPSSSSSSNIQRPVEDRIPENFEKETSNVWSLPEDNQKECDQSPGKATKLTKKPAVTPPKQTKFRQSVSGMESYYNTRNDDGRMNENDLYLGELEIQVPLQHVPGLTADIDRHENGRRSPSYEYIKTQKAGKKQNVAVITLNRPKALNALCTKLMTELNDAVTNFNNDDEIGAIIITGNEKAFAAGNDIKEMQNHTYAHALKENVRSNWKGMSKASKPIIAAVNGYALGGGCELAMMCDIIYAGEKARFGQSEIIFGTIPGGGGTQRLTRAIGKSKAMEMMLTGNQISAAEAEQSGLISKVFPPEDLLSEAIKLGERISAHSQLIVSMAKEAVNSAFQTKLQEGLRLENKIFCGTLATTDRKEGITAFIEKRAPQFKNE